MRSWCSFYYRILVVNVEPKHNFVPCFVSVHQLPVVDSKLEMAYCSLEETQKKPTTIGYNPPLGHSVSIQWCRLLTLSARLY